jgi:putative ABC transport system permease protein
MNSSSIRAMALVGRRNVASHRGRSLLVLALIALPVAAMVAGISIMRTTEPTEEQRDTWRMGRADLLVHGASESDVTAWLPDGSVLERAIHADGNLLLSGAKPHVGVRGLNLAGLAQGMLLLVEGRQPIGPTEAAVSAETARIAKVGIGGVIALDGGGPFTVVGFVENELYLEDRFVVLDPSAVPIADGDLGMWLVDVPEDVDPDTAAAAAYDPETGAPTVPFSIESRDYGGIQSVGGMDSSFTILVFGSLALVEAALVASAAFAVSIRRRQRELGLLAAAGATPGQLGGSVLLEAALLGAVAAVAGVVLGLLIAVALSPYIDELTGRRNQPLIVDVGGLLAPAIVGFVAALIAALAPAHTASRVPVLTALSGRRPAVAPARRTLQLGLLFVGLSVAMTLIGANQRLDGSDMPSVLLLIGGAVLGTLGFGACGPWLLERLEAVAVRLPLAGRIAFRDTARARSRSSPIVTAVLASFAATVALGTWTVSRDAENVAEWRPYLHPDQLSVRGAGAETAVAEVMKLEGAVESTPKVPLMLPEPAYFSILGPDARDAEGNVILFGPDEYPQPFALNDAVVATPGLLRSLHAEAAAADIAAGKVVVVWHEPVTLTHVEVEIWGDPELSEPTRRVRLPATALTSPVVGFSGALISQAQADDLGLEPWPESDYVVTFDRPVTEADVAAAADIAGKYVDTFADASFRPTAPDAAFRIVLIVLALLFAVSVTGVAIALGEAESRPEQRSLLALGAEPRLRRRIAASRAAVLTLLAGILAVPAGLLPVWGLLISREAPLAVPVLEIAGAVVALPLLAVFGAWLLSRPIPDWSAFRGVRPGE